MGGLVLNGFLLHTLLGGLCCPKCLSLSQEQMWATICRSELKVQADLCARVLLTGGWARMPGLAPRLLPALDAVAAGRNPVPFALTFNAATCRCVFVCF